MSEGFRPGSVAEKKEKQAQAWIGWELEKTLVIVGALAHEASLLLLWVSSCGSNSVNCMALWTARRCEVCVVWFPEEKSAMLG